MPYLRWHCSACSHAEETPSDVLLQQLRGVGLLRRVEAKEAQDLAYLLQLGRSVQEKLTCPDCGAGGYLPALADDDSASWGEARRCGNCHALIAPERLEVFPDT